MLPQVHCHIPSKPSVAHPQPCFETHPHTYTHTHMHTHKHPHTHTNIHARTIKTPHCQFLQYTSGNVATNKQQCNHIICLNWDNIASFAKWPKQCNLRTLLSAGLQSGNSSWHQQLAQLQHLAFWQQLCHWHPTMHKLKLKHANFLTHARSNINTMLVCSLRFIGLLINWLFGRIVS